MGVEQLPLCLPALLEYPQPCLLPSQTLRGAAQLPAAATDSSQLNTVSGMAAQHSLRSHDAHLRLERGVEGEGRAHGDGPAHGNVGGIACVVL